MGKSVYGMILVIFLHLLGCGPVTEKESDARKSDTLLSSPQPKALATTIIDTAGYTAEIQKYADSVEENLSSLIETKIDVFDSSAEGGEISIYRQGTDTLKLKAIYYGEVGKNEYELYLQNKKLVFFSEKAISYISPIGKDPVKIDKENSKSFVIYGEGVVLGKEGGVLVPKDEYITKSEDIRVIYKEIKLQLRE